MTVNAQSLRDLVLRLVARDLEAAQREVLAYPDDASLWRVVPGIGNSTGSLALHLAGNLRHFIGEVLGGTGYVRDRDAEFSARDLTRQDTARMLADALRDVTRTMRALDPSTLEREYPTTVGAALPVPADAFVVHLATHAAYHLGQMDYHRRIVTGDATTVGTIPLTALVGPLPESP